MTRYFPSPGSASLIRHFLVLKADDFTVNTLLPSDALTLVLRLSGSVYDVSSSTQELVPSTALTGARNFPRSVAYAPATKVVVVEFRPGASRRFLSFAPSDLFGRTLSAREIFGDGDIDRLEYRLFMAKTDQERMKIIEDFVLSAISDVQPHPAVERALSLIHRSNGQLSVRRLVESLGTNKDSLEKHFRRELGFGPKAFMRISRMKEALALVGGTESLSTLALQFGFSDQSHFNHEFRTMVGLTPQDFIRAGSRW
jgi:AraC-like DNA-binding protein